MNGVMEYIGMRYLTKFADPIEWDDTRQYEHMTVVQYQGGTYVSKQMVPVGVQITDTNYWLYWADFNAQIEQYRQEVRAFDGRITQAQSTANGASEAATQANASIATIDAILAGYAEGDTVKGDISTIYGILNGYAEGDTVKADISALQNAIGNVNDKIGTLPEGQTSVVGYIGAEVQTTDQRLDEIDTTLTGFDSTNQVKTYVDNAIAGVGTAKHAVFIGDSFTSAYYLTQAGASESDRWCYPVASFVNATPHIYAERGAGFRRVSPSSEGGHNFSDMLTIAAADTSFSNDEVAYLFVYGGLNDLDHESANSVFSTEYPAFCRNARLAFPNAKIYICGINAWPESLSVNEYVSGESHYARTQIFYEQVMKADDSFIAANCSFISMCGALGFASKYYYSENRHPNVLGNNAIATWIICAMSGTPICQSKSGNFTTSDSQTTGGQIVAHFKPGLVECFINLGAGFAGTHITDSLNIVVDQALDLRGVPLITESGSSVLVGYLGGHDNENTPYGAINVREHGFGRFVRAF